VPERNLQVLGDAMADWLAYGRDAYSNGHGHCQLHKTVSGLIKYQPREPADWTAAAKASSTEAGRHRHRTRAQ
jgi:hypothetical protein